MNLVLCSLKIHPLYWSVGVVRRARGDRGVGAPPLSPAVAVWARARPVLPVLTALERRMGPAGPRAVLPAALVRRLGTKHNKPCRNLDRRKPLRPWNYFKVHV